MPRDKTITNARIIQYMTEEFLEYGYEKASLNRVSAKVGITTAGLYKHFDSKEDMFSYLVKDTLDDFQAMKAHAEKQMEADENYNPFQSDWAAAWAEFIYNHYTGVKLLICCSAGSKFESFEDDLIKMEAISEEARLLARHQIDTAGSIHHLLVALMKSIALLLSLTNTLRSLAILGLVEAVAKTLTGFLHLLLNLVVVLGNLLLDEHIRTITLFGVAVVNEGIVERIHMAGGLPCCGMHEDGGIDAHDVLVKQHHRLPPILFDVVLQLHTILTVVIHGAETVVNITRRKNKSVFFTMRNYFLKNVFLLCHFM